MSDNPSPPRNGEGDRAQRGGGGIASLRRPETYAARRLRREMSLPEAMLWQHIRGKKLGFKFRRQHPIGPYVADFCCLTARLVVEIEGMAHDFAERSARDEQRIAFFEENEFAVLRIPAKDVLEDMQAVLAAIVTRAESPLHQPVAGPPPRSGEDL